MHECKNCGVVLNRRQDKYCSNKCQVDFQYKTYIAVWKEKSKKEEWSIKTKNISGYLKRYLISEQGEKCSLCGWHKRHPITEKVPLEIDHIDGNADNNNRKNLRVLCPNCHSLTTCFRNLNRTHGRAWRIERLKTKKD